MSEQHSGPYDGIRCHFCGKSSTTVKDWKNTAGYQRRETYANVGPWFDACEACARVEYQQPKQFQEVTHAKQ